MALFSPQLRRVLAVVLLVAPLVASALFVAIPARLVERYGAALSELEQHVGRLEQHLVNREQALAELRQLERMAKVDTKAMNGEPVGVAGAALAGQLANYLQQAGGRLKSTTVLEPVLDPPLIRIAVRLRGEIDLAGLRSLLHRVENAEPVLIVERIALQDHLNAAKINKISVDLIVAGYQRSQVISRR